MNVVPGLPSTPDTATRQARDEIAATPFDAARVSLVVLAVLAVLYTLYFAAEIVLPILLAMVLNLLLIPGKRLLTERLRLPGALAALLLIIGLFAVVTAIALAISVPASNWVGRAPEGLTLLQQRLRFIAPAVQFARKGFDQVQHLMQSGAAGTEAPPTQPMMVQQSSTSLGGVGMVVLSGARAALGQVLILLVVLFFTLAYGDSLLRSLVEIMPHFGDKRRVVDIANEIERNISGYLVTITVMNTLVGIANGLSMWALGMPDPLLWGTLAFLLNYIPILGPATGMMVFFFVGLFASPSLGHAFLAPAIYLGLHMLEGETVTPMLLARRFTLNPVLVIVSLFFWDWMWGVAGALLAVPLLAMLKIVCDRIPVLTPLGHLVGSPARKRAKA